MYHRKQLTSQLKSSGVRLGDGCSIYPVSGHKKVFTLNRKCIDLISKEYRPDNLSLCYFELPSLHREPFHYRLELEDVPTVDPRFVLKTIKGRPFSVNGLVAREAFIERDDRLFVDDSRLNFSSCDLKKMTNDFFEHPVLENINLIQSDLKILIQGETGTGKTHLARKIHEKSGRPGNFIAVNLSSFNPQLIESELFGHKKGSFTGAVSDKLGAFSLSENGTLFLDEVDSLPIEIQTKLLTFMDSKKFRKVGEIWENEINARLIFASGKCLEQLVQKGEFRSDFYYRLKSGHTLDLGTLRNDVNKIRKACEFYSLRNQVSLTPNLSIFYESLAWPGNLRQLFGHLDKKRILSKSSKLEFDELDEELMLQSSDLKSIGEKYEIMSLDNIKLDYAKKALGLCNGNISDAAKRLGVSQKTLRNLLNKV